MANYKKICFAILNMSSFCCINLKDSKVTADFENYNNLAKEIIANALKNNIAAFFNSYDYWQDLILKADMKAFFLLSERKKKKSCELLDNTCFIDIIENNSDMQVYKKAFEKKYKFFKELVEIIFKYDVSLIEIYLTEDDTTEIDDFKSMVSTKETILSDLFSCVIKSTPEFGNEFPTIKIIIKNI